MKVPQINTSLEGFPSLDDQKKTPEAPLSPALPDTGQSNPAIEDVKLLPVKQVPSGRPVLTKSIIDQQKVPIMQLLAKNQTGKKKRPPFTPQKSTDVPMASFLSRF